MIEWQPSFAIAAAALALCRVGGCFLVLPGLSSDRIPAQVRILMVIAISVSMAQYSWNFAQTSAISTVSSLLLAMFRESVIGLFMGLTVRFYLMALGFMANAMGVMIGFGNLTGPGIDATEPQAAIETLISMATLVVMFALDFHHGVIRGLAGSYDVVPIGGALPTTAILSNLSSTLNESFTLVLRLGSPFIAYALIVNLMIGVLNKLTPQIPVYFISLPYLIFGGLFVMYFAIPTIIALFVDGVFKAGIFR